ncbi:YceI family protein [Asticcacaulis sp. 201]|uniref:YceI family protein n=1 Tax=Asticcacaulis sp. 201 TaxID=3028787 RepID=UPI0029170BF2|nr:YceI family protein [Asticcacaulis sp. 201]MDV6331581.1 YceI family protein [Asticcacaulis sp. 201]
MKLLLPASVGLILLTACSPSPKNAPGEVASSSPSAASAAPSVDKIPAGEYRTDPAHTALTFTVNHLGYSHYTAQFASLDAHLTLDPAHPEAAVLKVTVDPRSLRLPTPPKGFYDELMGKQWFDAAAFPQITFASTQVEKTGVNTARVTGDLTLHGITKPVVLDVTFNGGYPGMAGFDPQARIGFSAHGVFKRSDFGMGYGIPAPGSQMGVGDDVAFTIETEMQGPPLKS